MASSFFLSTHSKTFTFYCFFNVLVEQSFWKCQKSEASCSNNRFSVFSINTDKSVNIFLNLRKNAATIDYSFWFLIIESTGKHKRSGISFSLRTEIVKCKFLWKLAARPRHVFYWGCEFSNLETHFLHTKTRRVLAASGSEKFPLNTSQLLNNTLYIMLFYNDIIMYLTLSDPFWVLSVLCLCVLFISVFIRSIYILMLTALGSSMYLYGKSEYAAQLDQLQRPTNIEP